MMRLTERILEDFDTVLVFPSGLSYNLHFYLTFGRLLSSLTLGSAYVSFPVLLYGNFL
jgi:hypothetical protein